MRRIGLFDHSEQVLDGGLVEHLPVLLGTLVQHRVDDQVTGVDLRLLGFVLLGELEEVVENAAFFLHGVVLVDVVLVEVPQEGELVGGPVFEDTHHAEELVQVSMALLTVLHQYLQNDDGLVLDLVGDGFLVKFAVLGAPELVELVCDDGVVQEPPGVLLAEDPDDLEPDVQRTQVFLGVSFEPENALHDGLGFAGETFSQREGFVHFLR